MDYPTFRPVTKPSYKQKTLPGKNFAENNFNHVNRSKTAKPPNMNTQNYSSSQSQDIPQPTSNSVNFNDQTRSSQEQSETYPLFQQDKKNTNKYQIKKTIIINTKNDSIQTKDLVLTKLINQIFLNHTHEMNKYDNLEIIQHLTIIIFNRQYTILPTNSNAFLKPTAILFTTT